MIVNEFYNTEGLGNQLWCYVVTRVLALDHGYNFGILSPEKFRGKEFMDLDFGFPVNGIKSDTWSNLLPQGITSYYKEELIRNRYGIDISPADQKLLNIKDCTKIDGHFQSMKYVENNKNEIVRWLQVKENPKYTNDNDVVIHLRGGDYIGSPANTLLPLSYYLYSIEYMKSIIPNAKFYVVTDDYNLARSYFDGIAEIVGSTPTGILGNNRASHHIGGEVETDYTIIHSAKNIIMSNSTFAFWAAWTNINMKNVIAPKYWFTYNHPDNFWSTAEMRVKEWKYLDRNGHIE